MPLKYRGSAGQAALNKMVESYVNASALNFEGLYQEIVSTVDAVIRSTTLNAQQVAIAKAPVRHIFKGGRTGYGRLSARMIMREFSAYAAAFPKANGVPWTREEYLAQRQGTRVVEHPNRSQNWANTGEMRRLDLKKGTRYTTQALSDSARRNLDARGRWEYMHVNRPGSAWMPGVAGEGWPAGPEAAIGHPTLGGGLVKSIRIEDTSSGNFPKLSLTAGGGKVYYARYQEFGTRHNAAHPFLRPALKSVEYNYSRRMQYALHQLARRRPLPLQIGPGGGE